MTIEQLTFSGKMLLAFATASVLGACATTEQRTGFNDVQDVIENRIGKEVRWHQGSKQDAAVKDAVRTLLQGVLTRDEAIQVALLNNPSLQAIYERLGIAQADLVQAGLLANPVFTAQIRSSSVGTQKEFGVVQEFLSLFTLLPKKQLAAQGVRRTKLEVAQAALELAAQVQAAYYTVAGDRQALELFRQMVTSSQAAAELAHRQYQAGNSSRRDQAAQQVFYAHTLLDLARVETQLQSDREKLNRVLGLWGQDTLWKVPERLPEVPESLPAFERLEAFALEQRLDVAASKQEITALGSALNFINRYRFLNMLGIGYSYERGTDGEKLKGPAIELGLPIFDRGQANRARLESLLRQSQRRLETLAIDIRSEVRDARNRLFATQEVAQHYRNVILPLHQQIVGETLKFYNGMLLGVYDLLLAKQNQVVAAREYINAIQNYWLTHAELERVVGGTLPDTLAPSSDSRAPRALEPTPSQDHQHH